MAAYDIWYVQSYRLYLVRQQLLFLMDCILMLDIVLAFKIIRAESIKKRDSGDCLQLKPNFPVPQ